jgi:peptidoglycan/LPS O-acetylase OafA/YrhL
MLCHVIFVAAMVTFNKGVAPAVNYFGILSYPLYLVHQDLGLIGIKLLTPEIGHLYAMLLVVFLAVVLAAVVQSIAVWLTAVLRRDWSFKAVR